MHDREDSPGRTPELEQIRILIVEDEALTAEDLRHTLTGFGYQISGVIGLGEEAVRAAREDNPSLVLMDIMLQGEMDGIEAARLIQAESRVPVIFLTAYSDTETIEKLKFAGSYGYILKPFERRELLANIGIALHKHRLEMRVMESEERYRTLFENSVVGIFQITAAGGLITANSTLANMLYYESVDELATAVTNIGTHLFAEDKKRREFLKRLIYNSSVENYETELLRRDSSRIWVSITVRVVGKGKRERIYEGIVFDISGRKSAEHNLHELELGRAAILRSALDAIITFSGDDGMILEFNPAASMMFGYRPEEIIGEHAAQLFNRARDEAGADEDRRDWIEHATVFFLNRRAETGAYRSDGSVFPAELSLSRINRDGTPIYAGFVRDITERLAAEKEMRKLSMVVEQSSDWIVITDSTGTIEYANDTVCALTGFSRDELIGGTPRLWKSGVHDEVFYRALWETALSGQNYTALFTNRKKSGELFHLDTTISPIRDPGGAILQLVARGSDVTEKLAMEERLNFLSFYDLLTELPNRNLFIDRLGQAIARAEYKERVVAVILLDIDRFKFLNDVLGMSAGDEILRVMSKRIGAAIREGDTLARSGSDEFALILDDMAHRDDLILMTEKLRNIISEPMSINEKDIVLTASMGVSICPDDSDDARVLLQNADIAMARAKNQGNTYRFYTTDLNEKAYEFLNMEALLRNAIASDEFELHYQPYFSASTEEVAGMESLLRWNSGELGSVPPARFIPVLEESGLILRVGYMVMEKTCRQIREWRDRGCRDVPVAINISPLQFRQKDFAERLVALVGECGVSPSMLTLEITESTFMRDPEFTRKTLEAFREAGFTVSIDDFGTGYSSLGYLKRYPLDTLKIDISFTKDVATDTDSRAIVSAIILMAHSLNLRTIAEGIETREQLEILRELGCDLIQGYYYSRPIPPAELEKKYL
ncbi:MAG TPA: EAL domain-containing protein [Spirochaetota bacterium]|nr:EAL domain-containing protein [Spirochaetota bacterium]